VALCKCFTSDGTCTCQHFKALELSLTLLRSRQQGQHFLSHFLLWIHDSLDLLAHLAGWVSLQSDSLADLSTRWRSHNLDRGMLWVTGTHYHPLGHNVSELARLQVCVDDTESLRHLLNRDELLQAGANGA
jgi:hypothetical protein